MLARVKKRRPCGAYYWSQRAPPVPSPSPPLPPPIFFPHTNLFPEGFRARFSLPYSPPPPFFSPQFLYFFCVFFLDFLSSQHRYRSGRSKITMGENFGRNDTTPSPDLEAKETCGSVLTPACSESEASVIVDSFDDFRRPPPPPHYLNAEAGQFTEWTDEKHRSYIHSLEAAFVTQLHRSLRLRGSLSQELSSRRATNYCTSSDKLRRNKNLMDSTNDSPVTSAGASINSCTSIGKRHTPSNPDFREDTQPCLNGRNLVENLIFSCESEGSSEHLQICHLCHNDSLTSTTEVSDQNFVDCKEGGLARGTSASKRLKKSAADSSSNHQIVPVGKFHKTISPTANHGSSKMEEKKHYELLSEHPESSISRKSDLHYFLRGS